MGNKKTNLDTKKLRAFTADELRDLPHAKALVKVEVTKLKSGGISKRYLMEVILFDNTMTLRFYYSQATFYIIKKLWQKTADEFYIMVPYRLVAGETEDLRLDHKGEWNKYCFFETLPCGVDHPELYTNMMLKKDQIQFLKLYDFFKPEYVVDRGRKESLIDQVETDLREELGN